MRQALGVITAALGGILAAMLAADVTGWPIRTVALTTAAVAGAWARGKVVECRVLVDLLGLESDLRAAIYTTLTLYAPADVLPTISERQMLADRAAADALQVIDGRRWR